MKLRVDKEADALYLLDSSDIVESVEVAAGVVLDYNDDEEEVVGVAERRRPGPAVRGR